jgi:hypothetical protein
MTYQFLYRVDGDFFPLLMTYLPLPWPKAKGVAFMPSQIVWYFKNNSLYVRGFLIFIEQLIHVRSPF